MCLVNLYQKCLYNHQLLGKDCFVIEGTLGLTMGSCSHLPLPTSLDACCWSLESWEKWSADRCRSLLQSLHRPTKSYVLKLCDLVLQHLSYFFTLTFALDLLSLEFCLAPLFTLVYDIHSPGSLSIHSFPSKRHRIH